MAWQCRQILYHKPQKRLYQFCTSLFYCLPRSARTVSQYYPENLIKLKWSQLSLSEHGGLVVNYPNSAKTKKYYLVLITGDQGPSPATIREKIALQTTENTWNYNEIQWAELLRVLSPELLSNPAMGEIADMIKLIPWSWVWTNSHKTYVEQVLNRI